MRSKQITNELSLGHLVQGILATALIWGLFFVDLSARDRPKDNSGAVYDSNDAHDGLQPVGNYEQCHTRSEAGTERILDDCVRLAVDRRSGWMGIQ